jgi:hypothetical protein
MNFKWLILAFLAAALVGGVIAACGGDSAGTTCTTDSNCSSGTVCHPTAKQCVKTCSSPSDCPNNQNFCAPFTGGVGADGGVATTPNICQCTSDSQCAGGSTGSTSICNNIDKICQTKCSRDSDCLAGRTCNTSSGQCVAGAGGRCTTQGTCGSGTICDFSNGTCGAPRSCNSANPQPDACSYGQYCATNCQEVPKPSSTCPNFGGSAHGLAWGYPSTGPIIHSVTLTTISSTDGYCPGGVPWHYQVNVRGYTTSNTNPPTFTATRAGIEGILHLVDPSGQEISSSGTVTNVSGSNGNRNVSFSVNYCRTASGAYSAGMHFINGNEYCTSIQ